MKPDLRNVSSEFPDPPYPADTRAKGIKFELDLERIHQSKTWVLAPPDMRPWLLMLWSESWRSVPVGSYENDDEIIAARIGMSLSIFHAHRKILMRGWYRATDGNLYHPVISEIVEKVQNWRQYERNRKRKYRDRKENTEKDQMSHGTNGDTLGLSLSSPSPSPSPSPTKEIGKNTPPSGLKKNIYRGEAPPKSAVTTRNPREREREETALPTPKNVDVDLWAEFLTQRKKLKATNSPLAVKILIGKIEKINQETGEKPNEIIERSLLNGWKSVFPRREDNVQKSRLGYVDEVARDKATYDMLQANARRHFPKMD